jgi:signal transduction histidine kinase
MRRHNRNPSAPRAGTPGQKPSDEVRLLLEISSILARTLDVQAVYAEATRIAATILSPPDATGRRRARLVRLDHGRMTLLGDLDEARAEGAASPPVQGPLPEPVLATLDDGRARVVDIEDIPPERRQRAASKRLASWAVARVPLEPGVFGILSVSTPDRDPFTGIDLALLEGIADLTGLAISNSLKHADLLKLKERLQLGLDFAMEAGSSLDAQGVIDGVMERGRDAVDADRISLIRFEGDSVEIVSSQGTDTHIPSLGGRRWPLASLYRQPLIERAIETKEPVIGGPLDVEQVETDVKPSIQDVRHTVVVPLLLGDELSGVLIATRGRDVAFTSSDAALLQQLGGVAMLALRNALLFRQAQSAREVADGAARRIGLAVAAAEDVAAEVDLPSVQWRLLERAMAVVRADRGAIARLDGDRLIVEHRFNRPSEKTEVSDVIPLADSPLAAETIRQRRPMLWNQLTRDLATGRGITSLPSALPDDLEGPHPRHALHLPLVVGQEVIGLLALSRIRDEPFTDADLLALKEFATLTALIVRNARLLAEALELSRAKSKFVNLAAHELRTPVSVLKGYLSMIADGVFGVPDGVLEGPIQIAMDKVTDLDDLVEQLVLVARLEAGKFVPTPTVFDVRAAILEAVDRVGRKLPPEHATFVVSLPEEGAQVRGDADSVNWILSHLIKNAVSYGPTPADVKIAIRAAGSVEISVEDRGYGIPPQHHGRVFEAFFRVDDANQIGVAGAGLGLTIARELAEASGGQLELERSEPGKGSLFVLRLQLAPPAAGHELTVVGGEAAPERQAETG